ncbi:hypothetical protein OsccyDRAFT_3554 [Leptolyngbyaceae cyanobacterium JSC-12]|nr:hypothetical protein OsccyDRAFT_3554 [Leptolyngbyaceae cyanobacterium JSC-12]
MCFPIDVMAASSDRPITIELVIRTEHPALLTGLDTWLQLGLISDSFVRRLCEEQLVCRLPETFLASNEAATSEPRSPALQSAGIPDFLPVEPSLTTSATSTQPPPDRPPNLVSQALQSLMAEISVVWLLFLGVFLVVMSSGVLAATQWRYVPPTGQYGILLGYTVLFWLASTWAGRQPSLQLTARMLAIATLLLIPVNVWMMDGFRLWSTPTGVGLVAVATLLLSSLTFLLLKATSNRLTIITAIALSWLHWGWAQPGIPLIATYLGTIGAAAILLHSPALPHRSITPSSPPSPPYFTPSLSLLTIAISALLLIARALFVAQIPVSQLGLAIGICGWLLCWLARRDRTRIGWARAGTVLFIVAWLVSVNVTPPWQAVVISGMGLWLLLDSLERTGQLFYLGTSFLVGLQLVWLVWRLFPVLWQQQIIAFWLRLAGMEAMPFALTGLGYFPYVLLIAGCAFYWRRSQRSAFANFAELLALALGSLLVAISFGNPLVRSLTLTLSALTLIATILTRPYTPALLVYLTHGTTLSSLFSWIYYGIPRLDLSSWAIILLVVVAVEWAYCGFWGQWARDRSQQVSSRNQERDNSNQAVPIPDHPLPGNHFPDCWSQSAWHFGLVLASISYLLLWQIPWNLANPWKLVWLGVPAGLTVLASRDRLPISHQAGWFSALTVIAAQPLMFGSSNTRLASLAIATFLMGWNTRRSPNLLMAALTVGFGLGLWMMTVWEVGRETLTFETVTVLIAITLLVLWGLWSLALSKRTTLAEAYRYALDGWAIAVLLLAFLVVSVIQAAVYAGEDTPQWQYLLTSALLVLATTFRTWRRGNDWGWYAIAWSIQLFVASSLALFGRSLDALATATIALGFLSQFLGDWQIRRRTNRQLSITHHPLPSINPSSWYLVPLVYGLLGAFLQHRSFIATTGLSTLALACIGMGIGRRSPHLKPLTLLSLIVASFAAYELLVYQLLQTTGGVPGDGIVLLAALAAAVAFGYRMLQRWIVPLLRLDLPELQIIAHLHWLLGNAWLILAYFFGISRTGQWWWTAIATLLAIYALLTSLNPSTSSTRTIWAYAGIIELLVAIAALLHLLLPYATLIDWAGAIAALLAVSFYMMPWHRWRLEQEPWCISAKLLPVVIILLTGWGANLQSLLVVAAFYAWLASVERQIRFSYVSILLTAWAIVRLLQFYGATDFIWYAAVVGGSLLYLAQVDPAFQAQQNREQRHWLRCLASGLVCLMAFYQAEVGIVGVAPVVAGFGAIALEFVFILAGLLQRVRAFLYVGTLTFILQIFWQLWRFISDYSLLLWVLGIILGLTLIWVAATFEARRSQMNVLLQHWIIELEDWQ